MAGPVAKKWILDLAPYVAGRSKVEGGVQPVKLSSNESTFGASPKAIEAAMATADGLMRYPDPNSFDLRQAIAEVHGLDHERIVCGAGSDELLSLLIHAYAGPGDEVIHSRYGFILYPIQTKAAGAQGIAVQNKDWAADIDGIIAAVTDRTKLVFVDNPNNPTGAYVPWSEIERLHAALPEHVVLCLDSAYAECATVDDYAAGEALVERATNVIMTRTFSKLYGLAGLRVGWAYGHASIIDIINRIRPPFNVTTPGQMAAMAAVRDQDFLRRAVEYNNEWREWLTANLLSIGLDVIPSQTNFVLVGFPADSDKSAAQANAYLTENGYLLRHLPGLGLVDHLRLSVGAPHENQGVVDLLRAFMHG